MSEAIRVLHVDTDGDFVDLVSSFLEDGGRDIEVVYEDNAVNGLERLREDDIDCIVSDYKMPEMNGLEFLEKVRERDDDLPFILFTGKGSEDIATEAIRAGVSDYIQKGAGKSKYDLLENKIENLVSQYRAEKEAEKSKRRLETVIENAPLILFSLDSDGNFTLSKGSALEKVGLGPGEAVGENVFDLYEDYPEIIEKAKEALEGEEKHSKVDMGDLSFETWYHPVDNSVDEETSVIGVSMDVTDQKRIEEELRESKRRIEKLHEITSEMMAVNEEEEIYELGVEAAERVLDFDICSLTVEEGGYLVSKAMTEGMEDKGHGRLLIDGESVAAKTFRNQESYIIDNVQESDEGKPSSDFFSSVISVPIGESGVFQAASEEVDAFDEDDVELVELLMSNVNEALKRIRFEQELKEERDSFADLFERLEKREEELMEERDRFAALFENVPEAVVSLKFDGKTPIVEDINPTFEEVFGYSEDEIVGNSLDDYIVPVEKSDEADDLNQRIMGGEMFREEARRRTTTGTRDFILQVVPYKVDDDSARGYAVYTDITERKERQRRLQVLNRVLRHNLRNEMNVILGHAQLLKMDISGSEPKDKVERIESKAEEITDLSDKAHQIERVVERTERSMREINVAEVIKRNAEKFDSKYPDADIEIDLPEEVLVHADNQISVAVDEIIENAIEHNDKPAPKISISLDDTKEKKNGFIGVQVADNGPGIPEEEREVLVEGQETPLHHGSGLGLWLVNWIVNKSGGTLSFDDNDPEGSVVTFKLSEVEAEQEKAEAD